MIDQKQKKILSLALKAGEIMLKSGAETYRVEDTMIRICKACNIGFVEVFATPTGLFISLDKGDMESDTYASLKRIREGSIDLQKISQVNQFSREFTTTNMTVDEGLAILQSIDRNRKYAWPLRILGAALIASFFTMLFKGTWLDFPCAFVAGGLLYGLVLCFDRLRINFFIRNFCSCALSTLFILIAGQFHLISNIDAVLIGTLMILVPGVAITNAVRDSLSGEMVAAGARAMEALLIAISLAAGVGAVLSLWVSLGGVL